jgi:adenylate cyclase class 2
MEVERKYKIDGGFSVIRDRLASLGFKRKKQKHQIDTYYLLLAQDDSCTNFRLGEDSAYLRLRHDVAAETFSLDLKLANEALHSAIFGEYECALVDAESFGNADAVLRLLGYKKGCVIDKKREAWVGGDFEVALDSVAGLGDFVEVETIAPEEESSAALKRVDDMSADLGLGKDTLMHTGYVDLFAWKKKGKDLYAEI